MNAIGLEVWLKVEEYVNVKVSVKLLPRNKLEAVYTVTT